MDLSVIKAASLDLESLPSQPTVSSFQQLRETFIQSKSEDWYLKNGLFFRYYSFLKSSLENATLDGPSQVACLDTISVWLRRIFNACKQDPEISKYVWDTMELKFWTNLFSLPANKISIPGLTGVQVAVKDVFSKSLQLYLLVCPSEDIKNYFLLDSLKHALHWDRHAKVVCTAIQLLVKVTGAEAVFAFQPDFFEQSLKLLKDYSYAQAISSTILTVLTLRFKSLSEEIEDREEVETKWMNIWCPIILDEFYGNDRQVQAGMSSFLIPSLLGVSPGITVKFLSRLQNYPNVSKDARDAACLYALKIAKDSKIIKNLDLVKEHAFVKTLFKHPDIKIQLACFRLIALCPNVSSPLSFEDFDCLESNIEFSFNVLDPDSRQILLKSMQDFFIRLRASCHSIARTMRSRHSDKVALSGLLDRAMQFLTSFISVCKKHLYPTCNYQQVLVSLSFLDTLISFGLDDNVESSSVREAQHVFPFSMVIIDRDLSRLMIDRLKDPYDDIRNLCLKILLSYKSLPGFISDSDAYFLFNHGLELLNAVRSHECDGGAKTIYLCNHFMEKSVQGSILANTKVILNRLKSNIEHAKTSLLEAAVNCPLQGYLIQLTYIFQSLSPTIVKNDNESWKNIVMELIKASETIWGLIKDVLCDDSPEGNLPDGEGEGGIVSNLEDTPAQLILSYSWRSLKETSSLLTVLLTKCLSLFDEEFTPFTLNYYGELMMTWLWEIRHRGAFTSVYPCFIEYCSFLFECNKHEISELPDPWLHKNLSVIQEKSSFITRRSGGIPLSITAILVAGKDKREQLIEQTVISLISIAKQPVEQKNIAGQFDLPQVHAMNTLKTIFTEHRLSSVSVEYLEPAIALSIEGFSHELWPIRNCSVMLFTALINRAFGSKKPKDAVNLGNNKGLSTKMFFSKFPTLHDYLLRELEVSVASLSSNDQPSTGLYPILNMFSRLQYAQPYGNENEWTGLSQFEPLIFKCTASRICKVREIASLSLTCLLDCSKMTTFIVSQLKGVAGLQQNEIHGKLLTIRAVLSCFFSKLTLQQVQEFYEVVPLAFINCFLEFTSSKTSFYAKKLFLEVLNSYFMSNTDSNAKRLQQLRRMTMDYCKRMLLDRKANATNVFNTIGLPIHQQMAATIFLENLKEFSVYCDAHSIGFLVSKLLHYEFYEVQLTTLRSIVDSPRKKIIVNNPEILQALIKLTPRNQWSQVRALALSLLSDSLNSTSYRLLGISCSDMISNILSNECLPIKESFIVLLGSCIKQLKTENFLEYKVTFAKWVEILLSYSNEYQPFSSRKAALDSIIHFDLFNAELTAEAFSPEFYILYLLLGDFLNDDDEEIRSLAANHAYQVLGTSAQCVTEIWNLWKLRTKAIFGGQHDFQHCINKRLILEDGCELASVQLDNALARNCSLFERERQNLYYSDNQKLEDLLFYASFPNEKLKDWATDGINAILSRFEDVSRDGPLGKTSDPNVWFTIYKIIRIAEHVHLPLDRVHNLMNRIDGHPSFCQ